jgi:hypothetical protein
VYNPAANDEQCQALFNNLNEYSQSGKVEDSLVNQQIISEHYKIKLR